jgi:hypothetical protein
MPTTVTDIIESENFLPYIVNRTMELSALFQSGIAAVVPDLTLGNRGGSEVQMPYWNDLAGEDQILDSETDLTVTGFTTGKDRAVLHGRALVYGATDLAGIFAGDDPMAILGDRLANKWAIQMQKLLLSTLAGAMGANSGNNTLNISAGAGDAAVIDGEAMIDATGVLGDAAGGLTAAAMHSASVRVLAKQGLIDYIPDAEGRPTVATYMGKRVIMDDMMPVSNGVYTTYLFGPGAIGYAETPHKVPSEMHRDPKAGGGTDIAYNRRLFVMHPRGIAWNPGVGVPDKDTPTNAEVAGTANWNRVWAPKSIRIVRFIHRIAAA